MSFVSPVETQLVTASAVASQIKSNKNFGGPIAFLFEPLSSQFLIDFASEMKASFLSRGVFGLCDEDGGLRLIGFRQSRIPTFVSMVKQRKSGREILEM